MSMSAIVTDMPAARAASVSIARRPTTAPWLSVPVSGSRRVDSISSAVCRVRRRWAARKIRKSSAAAISAADSVTSTTSRRTEREAIEDRHRIAPDRDDAEHLAVDA